MLRFLLRNLHLLASTEVSLTPFESQSHNAHPTSVTRHLLPLLHHSPQVCNVTAAYSLAVQRDGRFGLLVLHTYLGNYSYRCYWLLAQEPK